jgi:hypothetical protein
MHQAPLPKPGAQATVGVLLAADETRIQRASASVGALFILQLSCMGDTLAKAQLC